MADPSRGAGRGRGRPALELRERATSSVRGRESSSAYREGGWSERLGMRRGRECLPSGPGKGYLVDFMGEIT